VSAAGWVAAGLGAACWLGVLPASAAISAQIPEECGSLSEFEFELTQRLGGLSATEATRVTLTPEPTGYRLVVEAGNQRRELHDASCQELLRAAIVIAIALLDPKREEATPPAAGPEQPAQNAPPLPAAPPAPPVQTAPNHSRSRAEFALAGGVGIHLGLLPQATLMLEIDAQLKWTRFGVAAGLRYLLPQSTGDESEPGARVRAGGAYLAGLFEPWHRVQARVGIATYRLSASSMGSVEPGEGTAWEVAPTLGATFTPFERPPFWTGLGLEGQLNLIQPTFKILPDYEAFQVPLLSGSAFARAGVVF